MKSSETKEPETKRPLYINKIISTVARNYNFSPAIVARLSFWYSYDRAISLIETLRKPPKNVVICVNTLRSNIRYVIDELKRAGLSPTPSKLFKDTILIPIEGPFQLETTGLKRIIAKVQAAEDIMMGAPRLYHPGVLQVEDGIKPGDTIAVTTKFGDVVAVGKSLIASTEEPSGPVAEITKSIYQKPNLKALKVFIRGFAYESNLASLQALEMWDVKPDSRILMISPKLSDLIWTLNQTRGRADIVIISKTATEEKKLQEGLRNLKMDQYVDKAEWLSGNLKKIDISEGAFDYIYIRPKSTKIGLRPRLAALLKERDFISCFRDAMFLIRKFSLGLKKGGRLLYMAESFDPIEGEYILEILIEKFKFKAVRQPIKFGEAGLLGFAGSDCALRTFPDKQDDIGLFAAVVTR